MKPDIIVSTLYLLQMLMLFVDHQEYTIKDTHILGVILLNESFKLLNRAWNKKKKSNSHIFLQV